MKKSQFTEFNNLRKEFHEYTESISHTDSSTIPVYNTDLDIIKECDTIKFILVADNPGKNEFIENKYLIGKAGVQVRNFFEKNSLVSDFTKEVIVLNKTCLHTNSTKDLKSKNIRPDILINSQQFMAELVFKIHRTLGAELWIIGCSEINQRGIFASFREIIINHYRNSEMFKKLYCFKHFSFGNFQKDIIKYSSLNSSGNITDSVHAIGNNMKKDVFPELYK